MRVDPRPEALIRQTQISEYSKIWWSLGTLTTLFRLMLAQWNTIIYINGRAFAGHSIAERNRKNMQIFWVVVIYSFLLTSLEVSGVTCLPESSFWLAPDPIRLRTNVGQVWHVKIQQFQSGQSLLQPTYRRHLGARSLSEATADRSFSFHLCHSLPDSLSLWTQALIQNRHKGGAKVTKCKKRPKYI